MEMMSNPAYMSSNELLGKATGQNHITSTREVASKVSGSSEPGVLQSKCHKRVIEIILCIAVALSLAIAGLAVAVALAFLEIRNPSSEKLESINSPTAADQVLQEDVWISFQSQIMQLTDEMHQLNYTVLELQEMLRNRTEESRGLPGKQLYSR